MFGHALIQHDVEHHEKLMGGDVRSNEIARSVSPHGTVSPTLQRIAARRISCGEGNEVFNPRVILCRETVMALSPEALRLIRGFGIDLPKNTSVEDLVLAGGKIVVILGLVGFLATSLFPLVNRTEAELEARTDAAQTVTAAVEEELKVRKISDIPAERTSLVQLTPLVSARVSVAIQQETAGEPLREPAREIQADGVDHWVVPTSTTFVVRWDLAVFVVASAAVIYVAVRTFHPKQVTPSPEVGLVVDKPYSAEQYLIIDVERALDRSQELLSRSTLLLVGGVLMAFVGVAVFFVSLGGGVLSGGGASYTLTNVKDVTITNGSPSEFSSLQERIFQAFKSTAMLLFIEAIAWFLLRQHRVLIEDYKSFYRLYIRRTNYLTVLKLVAESTDASHKGLLINALLIEDLSGRLRQGETTEGLEDQKLTDRNFAELALNSVTDLAGRAISKEKAAGKAVSGYPGAPLPPQSPDKCGVL
jgi:hypothetical protein